MSLFDVTVDSIKADIIKNYTGGLDTRAGSYFDTIISPIAYEFYRIYKSTEALQSMILLTEESGVYIDDAAATYGMTRKAGVHARAEIVLSGTPGASIPAGTIFVTGDGLAFTLDTEIILDESGSGAGTVVATEPGTAYNVAAGAISGLYTLVPGLESFSAGAASGGTENESNAELLQRYLALMQNASTGGNEADYKSWAMSVEGVTSAYVIPRWNGVNTVKVIVSGNAGSASDEVVSKVDTFIQSCRPTGADVTVESAAVMSIDISASVTLQTGYDVNAVQTVFRQLVSDYLQQIGVQGSTISYNKIASMLFDVPGIEDYSSLTLAGSTESIILDVGTAPMLGTITITEAVR